MILVASFLILKSDKLKKSYLIKFTTVYKFGQLAKRF